jgi:cysteinyl-tRNA synthetase
LIEDQPADALARDLETAKADLDAALRDSFNTPEAMRVVLQIIRAANIELAAKTPSLSSIKAVAQWVTRVVGILGLDAHAVPPYDGLGWAVAGTDADPKDVVRPYAAVFTAVTSDAAALALSDDALGQFLSQSPDTEFADLEAAGERNPETLALPYLRAISRLRDALRALVPSLTADKETKSKVLALCDRIRDDDLVPLGVQLDDTTDGSPSTIKFVPAERLLAAQREKRELAEQRRLAKEEQARKREAEEQARLERAKVPHTEMFKGGEHSGKYGAWDERGIPTKLADGTELPKSQVKKVTKEWERQKKVHEEWLAKQ